MNLFHWPEDRLAPPTVATLLTASFDLGTLQGYCRLYWSNELGEAGDFAGWAPRCKTAQIIRIPIALSPGRRWGLAVQTIAPSGLAETNTQRRVWLEIDQDSALLPAPLPPVFDVTAEAIDDETLRVGFSCIVPPGFGRPTSFDVFRAPDDQARARVATLDAPDTPAMDLEFTLPADTLPATFSVRACAENQTGPESEWVRLAPPETPACVVPL